MPSPFPGMDPYLEHPDIFPGLHDDLISQMKEALQQTLPEPYYTTSKSRAWIEMSYRSIEPDVDVVRPREKPQPSQKSNGTAVATSPSRSVLVRVPHDEYREVFLNVCTLQVGDSVVA